MRKMAASGLVGLGVLVLGACGGGGSKPSSTGSSSGNGVGDVAQFCTHYIAGANDFSQITSPGDVSDLNYIAAEGEMEQAEPFAPPAMRSDIAYIVNTMHKADNATKGSVYLDPKYSQRISTWAASNCPSTSTTTSSVPGNSGSGSGNSGTGNSGSGSTSTTTGLGNSGSGTTSTTGSGLGNSGAGNSGVGNSG